MNGNWSSGARVNLLGLSEQRLAAALGALADRPFRVRQVYQAIHRRGVANFAQMTELPAALRDELSSRFSLALPALAERRDADDGTTKFLLRLEDGTSIETVDIPDGQRRTLCLSSQAGCALACAFCVTGHWGAGRQLDAAEIVGQVRLVKDLADLPESFNIVFMGMGEPLLNLEAVAEAFVLLTETLSPRRITLSTAGVVPGIDALGRWPERPNLALSLHAPDDERRRRVMPIARTWPLAELVAALRRYPLEPRRRLTIEYLLLADFNDSPRDADQLVRLLDGVRAKFNLIPFNPDPVLPSWMSRPSTERVEAFRARLESRGATVTVRRPRGDDVAAACGQLRAFARAPHGPRARPSRETRRSSRV